MKMRDNEDLLNQHLARRFRGPNVAFYLYAFVVLTFLGPEKSLNGQHTDGSIEPPSTASLAFQAGAKGVQIYSCMTIADGVKWSLAKPNAHLFDSSGKGIGSHFAGPTWKLNDGSAVQGDLIASRPSQDVDSVPWLLLRAKANSGTGKLANIAFIRRADTHGGAAPRSGCETDKDVGKTIEVPYTATYSFYSIAK